MDLAKKIRNVVLASALIGGGLVGVVNAQEVPKKFNIPERFNDYTSTTPIIYSLLMGDYLLEAHDYDMDGDYKMDVGELYIPGNPQPLFYGFDLNRNGTFGSDEVLTDKSQDGLNGNEEWLVPKLIV